MPSVRACTIFSLKNNEISSGLEVLNLDQNFTERHILDKGKKKLKMSFILNALDIEVFPRKELFGILNLSSQNYTFGAKFHNFLRLAPSLSSSCSIILCPDGYMIPDQSISDS